MRKRRECTEYMLYVYSQLSGNGRDQGLQKLYFKYLLAWHPGGTKVQLLRKKVPGVAGLKNPTVKQSGEYRPVHRRQTNVRTQ